MKKSKAKAGKVKRETGKAYVKEGERGGRYFLILDDGCRESFKQKRISFSANAFPVGTEIIILEPAK